MAGYERDTGKKRTGKPARSAAGKTPSKSTSRLTDKSARKSGGKPRFDFGKLVFGGIEKKLKEGKYVSGAELADVLEANGGQHLTGEALAYVCRMLRKPVKAPIGKKAKDELERQLEEMLIGGNYHRYLAAYKWLQRRRGELVCDGYRVTPAEAAARRVAHMFLGHSNQWRTVQNLASSRKRYLSR